MKIVGIIPSRYESSRFEGKPLADIKGRPMIWWVYQQVIKVKEFDDVYVATDSQQIYEVCEQYGIKVLMTSDQCATGTDRLAEVAQELEADFYVNIQGDEPLIEPETIKAVIDYKLAHPEVEVINTMTDLEPEQDVRTDTIVKAASGKNDTLLYLSRSPIPFSKKHQPVHYRRHMGLYGLSRKALLFFGSSERGEVEQIEDVEMLRFLENGYGIKIIPVVTHSLGVDRPSDIDAVVAKMDELGIDVHQTVAPTRG